MDLITILEANHLFDYNNHKKYWFIFLNIQKYKIEKHFNWLKLEIINKDKTLYGSGSIEVNSEN